MTTTSPTALAPPAARPSATRVAGRRQAGVLVGQLVAGVGNLVASLLVARLLVPGDYAAFTAFLGGYVLIHTVASSISAATAVDPGLHGRLWRRAALLGLALGGGLVVLAPTLAPVVGLSVVTVALLGASVPSAALLALVRGRLYGTHHVAGSVATLATEPLVRIGAGLALLPVVGPVGAAVGVVAGGYAALAVGSLAGRGRTADPGATARRGTSALTAGAFLLVAVIAAQDVLFANKMLEPGSAGLLAATATIGGAAYFATATIPMVLLPSGGADRREARASLAVALAAAVGVSAAAVGAVALVPASVLGSVVGDEYAGIGGLATGYVAAMGALGTAKVLLARLCTTGRGRTAVALVAVAVGVQLALLLQAATPLDVVTATAGASVLLLVTAGVGVLVVPAVATARPAPVVPATAPAEEPVAAPAEPGRRRAPRAWREAFVVLSAVAVGLGLRLLVTRSIWLDEAISIRQAQLPYVDMLVDLRDNDVHPPGYHTVMWLLVQSTGSTAEWVVRMPSLVAGTVMIPVFYAMGRDLWDRRTGRIAAFVVAVAPLAVWYSQEARMYALWMLAATLATWAVLRLLRAGRRLDERGRGGRGSLGDWVMLTLSSVALVYLQWFAVLPVVVLHLVMLAAVARRPTRRLALGWLGSVATSLLLLLPLVEFGLKQAASIVAAGGGTPAQTGGDASAVASSSPDVYAVLANAIWAGWGYHADSIMVQVSACWPVLLLLVLGALGRGRSRTVGLIVLVAAAPTVLLFAIGFERRQLFELRYFTTVVPLLLLLVSRAVAGWARGPVVRVAVPVLLVASLGVGLLDQQVNQSNPRTYDFRGATAWIEDSAQDGDVVVYAPDFLKDEMAYYDTGLPTGSTSRVDVERPGAGLAVQPASGHSVYVFGSFLEEAGVSGEVGRTLSELEQAGWTKVDTFTSENIAVWQLQGVPTDPVAPTVPEKEAAR